MQRLNLLYNRTKHAESAITAEQLPPDGTLPVWLKNDGLHSVESSLTFEEIAEMLEDLAVWADAAQNPATPSPSGIDLRRTSALMLEIFLHLILDP